MSLEGNSLQSSDSSASDNSSDANTQNLLEQIDDYDFEDEEDWDSVVYHGPLNNNGPYQLPAETDGWYPFGKLENTIGIMLKSLARNQLTQRQYKAIRSALNSTTSPLGNPCHSLPLKDLLRLDLAKPHVLATWPFMLLLKRMV
ncbi:hypothetical protein DFH28DRAFT_1194137 [Melampsora americana]|nr:hypothetical protein DFH28DRAFT_1194137 [Melampsora americana]